MGCLVLIVVLVGLPMAEIALISKASAMIGGWDTFILLVLSAVLGTYLAKHQGAVVLLRLQQCLGAGRVPTTEMVDGFLVFLGGVLFIFPGFVSDMIGLVLLFPLTRWLVRRIFVASFPSQKASPREEKEVDRTKVADAEVVE